MDTKIQRIAEGSRVHCNKIRTNARAAVDSVRKETASSARAGSRVGIHTYRIGGHLGENIGRANSIAN